MKDQIRQIEQEALKEIASAGLSMDALEALRVKYLGRKGTVTELFKTMALLPPDEKPGIGVLINALKSTVTSALDGRIAGAARSGEEADRVDVTLPGIAGKPGRIHPVTQTINQICSVFISLGFKIVEGPEIETERYNFEALNIPLEHPSRDAFDTFYLKSSEKYLLRSHTSPVQARFMEKNKPPFSIIVPGKVYRPDATDASHSFMFHQIEGLAVSDSIRFSDLKGVLEIFAKQLFGKETKMRFRPSFFPFTEPSAEVDISCILCSNQRLPPAKQGAGQAEAGSQKRCSLCGGKGWIEILGAGMVNPKVFKNVGYDPEKVTGFAFGMGVERIAILKYGIPDIRLFFENDVRFLKQF
ncbi:MAG: phenylalanine--tRNA ligase subunit alpha [Candidatus Omnitrophica bacterium]|nr:phenylalanine--tRNA ligase subunit alpha [Candidatus Omnitrophota bacterium]MDD5436172.1 phenylalanine--tRNA ligase subunit alpha [Candidatus Omnitrophota bacterium]